MLYFNTNVGATLVSVQAGEVVHRLGRSVADRRHRPAQIREGFSNGNQLAALTLHSLSFSHATQTRQAGYFPSPDWGGLTDFALSRLISWSTKFSIPLRPSGDTRRSLRDKFQAELSASRSSCE